MSNGKRWKLQKYQTCPILLPNKAGCIIAIFVVYVTYLTGPTAMGKVVVIWIDKLSMP